jgi:hypothetical protein
MMIIFLDHKGITETYVPCRNLVYITSLCTAMLLSKRMKFAEVTNDRPLE